MVDVKISELPVAGSAAGTDQLEANQAGTSRSITVAQVGTALALTGYAPLASPVFTGDPQAPTPATADNDTSVATTAFVKAQAYAVAANYLPLTGGTLAGPGTLTGTAATFSGNVQVDRLGVGSAANPSIKATIYDATLQTGFNYLTEFRQQNTASNFTSLLIEQNAANVVNFEVSNQANVKGTLNLQPFGGTVSIPILTGTTATFTGTVSAPGAQIQMVNVQTGAVATGSTIIPADNTIPQQTEGDQYMSLAITPKSVTSKLIIEVVFHFGCSVANIGVFAALFQDATANALATSWMTNGNAGGIPMSLSFRHTMTSGTTSATTFKLRAGPQSAATVTFNGVSGGAFMGGTLASSIVIREVA